MNEFDSFFVSHELEWSDSDEEKEVQKYIMRSDQQHINPDYLDAPELMIDQSDLIDPETKLPDYKRSYFSGAVKMNETQDKFHITNSKTIKRSVSQSLKSHTYKFSKNLEFPLPKMPHLTYNTISKDIINLIWFEFIEQGSDESELLMVSKLTEVDTQIYQQINVRLPFTQLSCLNGKLDLDDYVEFVDVISELVMLIENSTTYCQEVVNSEFPLPCCSFSGCKHRNKGISVTSDDSQHPDEEELDSAFTESQLFRLNIIFKQIQHDCNGKIRIKHVFDICKQLDIPYNKHQLPQTVLMNQTECIMSSQYECKRLIEMIRVRDDGKLAEIKGLFRFVLPQWLKEEFKGSEILLYEHHFTLIDKDGGGSIDVDELQQLLLGFGTKVTHDEAQAMLDEYDMDGGGTIDFVEFMVLIYKIQRGTIDMNNSELAQALVEAKSQLKIFEEIEEVKRHPPDHCSVLNFGNTPVTATFTIHGVEDTMYSDTEVCLQLIFYDGYPYRAPDIKILNRIFHINIITQLDGGCRLMHMKDTWSADWSIAKLLTHILSLLTTPNLTLLPAIMLDIYTQWKRQLYDVVLPRSMQWREDKMIYIENMEKYEVYMKQLDSVTLTKQEVDVDVDDGGVTYYSEYKLQQQSLIAEVKSSAHSKSKSIEYKQSASSSESVPLVGVIPSKVPSSVPRLPLSIISDSKYTMSQSYYTNYDYSYSQSYYSSSMKEDSAFDDISPLSTCRSDYKQSSYPTTSTADTKHHSQSIESKQITPLHTSRSSMNKEHKAESPKNLIPIKPKELIPARYIPGLTIEMLNTEQTTLKISKLSRIEQMHLTVLFAYLVDRDKYARVVKDYAKKYTIDRESSTGNSSVEGDDDSNH